MDHLTDSIDVEVVYATAHDQALIAVQVPCGASPLEAVQRSGILAQFPNMARPLRMGIFGKEIKDPEHYKLRQGDRVELYRPLLMTPRQLRERRLQRLKDTKKPA